jgi:hypothetical protein
MTSLRKIVISSCDKCPKSDHSGGFGPIAYIPVCRLSNKTLPRSEEPDNSGRHIRIVAKPTNIIPDWRQLEKN